MKSLKPILCLLVMVLLAALLAGQALAERPEAREIKSKVMWGDPDEPAGCREVDLWWREVNGPPDCEMVLTRPAPRSTAFQEVQTLGVNMTLRGLEVGCGRHSEDR